MGILEDKRVSYGVVGLLLLVFFVKGLWVAANCGITNDENLHIPAAVSYWHTGDFRMNTEHPTFTKWLIGLPLVAMGVKYPSDSAGWDKKDQNLFAKDFWRENRDRRRAILFAARVPLLLYTAIMGVFVFLFARSIYNVKAGLLATFLFVFEPNITAHAVLANSDAPVGMAVLAALYFAHRFLFTLKNKHFIGMLVFASIAAITKFSALMLMPLILIIYIYYLRNYPAQFQIPEHLLGIKLPRKHGVFRNTMFVLLTMLWFFIAGTFVMLASYLFHLTHITNENTPHFVWLAQQNIPGWLPGKAALIDLCQKIPLPKEFIMGVYQVYFHNHIGHPAFLLGRHEIMGWWYYFPVVFFFKTPVALLVLLLMSFLYSFRKDREVWIAEAVLAIPIVVYAALAMLSHLNLGVRHLLFIFPLLIVYASGVLAVSFRKKKKFDPDEYKVGGKPKPSKETSVRTLAWNSVVIGLCLYYLLSIFSQAPWFLGYMNELAGNAQRRAYIMSDSNTDWGQGLPALAEWVKKNGVEGIHLYYNLNDDPSLYGFKYQLEDPKSLDPARFKEGQIYAVSLWLVAGMDQTTHYTLYPEQRELARKRYAAFAGLSPDAAVGNAFWIFAP